MAKTYGLGDESMRLQAANSRDSSVANLSVVKREESERLFCGEKVVLFWLLKKSFHTAENTRSP